jgi:23S rRNA (adenine2030-N6)-methyltransferase
MNYRHGFHAGNFADVVKHATLARIVAHLCAKPAAFRVIDAHAGAGLYDLAGTEANRTGEWHNGIERLLQADLDASITPQARELLAPYLDAVAAFNSPGAVTVYPGSPMLLRAWLRRQDRLIACELEPAAAAALAENLAGPRAKALAIDGWTALAAYVPPKERRGLVLIDPPFEAADDFARLPAALAEAQRKWATGIYLVWYPIKDRGGPDALARRLTRLGIAKILRAELTVSHPPDPSRLNGCGLIVVNPPWTLESELAILLPALSACLGQGQGGFRLDWIARES